MAGVPPKSGEAYTLYFSVTDQADTDIFRANPTIAAGDFQYSNDGGANFANPGTLPSVVAGNNKVIQAPLTGGEMTPSVGDKILFAGSDQVGAEWQDILIVLTVTAREVDDLAFPNTSGRGMDVDADGGVEVGAMQTDVLTADALATSAVTEIQSGLATGTNQTTILNRIGAFTGTGVNSILGFLRAIMRSDADTPSDVGGSYDDATDSLQAIRDLLQSTTVNVVSVVEGSVITIVRGDTLVANIDGLGDISNYEKLWFTVKRDRDDADSASILQVVLTNPAAATDGLLYLNAAAATASQGSITVDDATAGDITIAIDEAATAQLAAQACVYDIQVLRSTGAVNTLAEGECDVNADVTRATS